MRTNSEYEIFVNLENENGEVSAPALVRSLKRQISYIQIDPIEEATRRKSSGRESGGSSSGGITSPQLVTSTSTNGTTTDTNTNGATNGGGLCDDDVFHTEKFIDTTNTTSVNSEGQMIRRSKLKK